MQGLKSGFGTTCRGGKGQEVGGRFKSHTYTCG